LTLGDLGSYMSEAVGVARRMMNVETNRFDYVLAGTTPGTGGAVDCISLLAEGDDFNQRAGHSVRTLSLEMRVRAQLNAALTNDLIRFVVFSDLEQAGVMPTPAQLLETLSPLAPFQHDNTQRFVVLHDHLIQLDSGGSGAGKALVIKMPLDVHIRFSGTTGVIAGAREGHLFWCAIAVQNANPSTIDVASRVSYVDN